MLLQILSFTLDFSLTSILFGVLALLVTFIARDQWSNQSKRKGLPGPQFHWPVLGGLVEMIRDPETFWRRQDGYGDVSWNNIAGKFMIHLTRPDLIRQVLTHDSPTEMKMQVHPNAELILGANNIAFMQGKAHKDLRAQLLPLFTLRALGFYVTLQDELCRKYLQEWLKPENEGQEVEFRWYARDLNTITSYKVFVGPYLDDQQMQVFARHYQEMNNGFLCVPINLPGTTLNLAIKARVKVVEMLEEATVKSKERMKKGEEPLCLLDFWMEKMVAAIDEAEMKGTPLPTHHEDYEIALTMLDFLFASQDASTSSLVWTVSILSHYPEILERVRQEQVLLRPNDEPVTQELLAKMTYTNQVVKEILRYKPPATMIPQMAQEDFRVSDDLVIPKGTLVTPSLWAATYNGFPDPDKFDPDRFSPERDDKKLFVSNFLTFGVGNHACMGQRYAMNHLTAFLAIMASNCTWTRRVTSESEKILYLPTIYPKDCLVRLKKIRAN